MAETEPRTPEEILNEIFENLKSAEDDQILKGINSLQNTNFSSEAIRRQLERLSLYSNNLQVRDEARAALNLLSNRAVQKLSNTVDRGIRFTILNEIKKWVNDGLLAKENADVIQSRYDFDFTAQSEHVVDSTPSKISQPAEPQPRQTLLQTLTSEAAIKIYLYLGAFFVISAATFVGVAVPELRLPILIIGTILFGGLAFLIKKRLPQPSFALFIVFSFLLPITAGNLEETLRDMLDFSSTVTAIYWVVINLFLTIIWGIGTRIYNSRLFSITAFTAWVFVFYQIGKIVDSEPELYTLLIGLSTFGGLAGVLLLKKWKDSQFAFPLFLTAQLLQGLVLCASIIIFTVKVFDPINLPIWHVVPFFVWVLGFIFIIISDRQYPFFAFAWLAAGALIPLPWFIAAAFDIESLGSTVILFIWGFVLAIVSEVIHKNETMYKFSLPLLVASLITFGLSIITAFAYEIWLGLVVALVITLVLTVLHIFRTRWWLWILALLNFTIAYFAFFNLDFLKNLDVPFVFVWLGLSILFLLPDIFLKKDLKNNLAWRLPYRIFGGLFTLITAGMLFVDMQNTNAVIGFGVYTLLFLTLSLLYKNPTLFYAFTLTLPIFVTFLFRLVDFTKWIHPVIVIAVIYYVIGFLLRSRESAKAWGSTLIYSALGIGTFIAIASPILGGLDAVIPIAVAATLWAVEAFLKRNAWLAFPANGLYLLAYFILLFELNVEQPQFFSIGTAILGLLQHYLLVRSGSKPGAFIMGMLSQFVLLGTTYIQMINEESGLIYFIILFFQSLVVLVYGIIFRSRSLTFFPIGFVVLGVITVVLGQLQGIGTIVVIGCAGILLLGLGIIAVILRERIAKLGEKLSDWQA